MESKIKQHKQKNEISLVSMVLFTCLILSLLFGLTSLFYCTTYVNQTNDLVSYVGINQYYVINETQQFIFALNPFAISMIVFISFAFLISFFEWLNKFLTTLYLIKIYSWKIFFDNPFFNQLVLYVAIFYGIIFATACPNPFLVNELHFYVLNTINFSWSITNNLIVFGFFYCLFSLYILFITLNQADATKSEKIQGRINMKSIVICGITGSVGLQTLAVVNALKDKLKIVGCSYFNNVKQMQDILKHNQIEYVYSPAQKDFVNVTSYEQLIKKAKPDLIVNAISGLAGLDLSFLSIQNKIDLALANKESLVSAGYLLTQQAKMNNVRIYPIDSEHASLKVLLDGFAINEVKSLLITCSGGPFYHYNSADLHQITYEQAIKHPTWNMGPKISIDSATLMNKTFEIIEAYWLFNFKDIKAIYHPQSIVHAMLMLKNNDVIMNSAKTDMKLPIQLAINDFSNNDRIIEELSFADLLLSFGEIDLNKWQALNLAYEYIDKYKETTFGVIITQLDEIAITLFKNQQLAFDEIVPFIKQNIAKYKIEHIYNLQQIKNLAKQIQNDFLSK